MPREHRWRSTGAVLVRPGNSRYVNPGQTAWCCVQCGATVVTLNTANKPTLNNILVSMDNGGQVRVTQCARTAWKRLDGL